MATLEQAILARMSFDPSHLFVGVTDDNQVKAWCHVARQASVSEFAGDTSDSSANTDIDLSEARILALCFSPDGGLEVCESLLASTQRKLANEGVSRLVVGPVRDRCFGYAGLPPNGYGFGIPDSDSRTSTLLSRRGFTAGMGLSRLEVSTTPYRPKVSREALQLRRTSRFQRSINLPTDPIVASSLSHFDVECHQAFNHQTGQLIAEMELLTSDVEAQVMGVDQAILRIPSDNDSESFELSTGESFLIGSLLQTAADRRVYRVETVVNSNAKRLIDQLGELQFRLAQHGHQWEKDLTELDD